MTSDNTENHVQTSVSSPPPAEITPNLLATSEHSADTSGPTPRTGRVLPCRKANGSLELRYAPRTPNPDTGLSSTQV